MKAAVWAPRAKEVRLVLADGPERRLARCDDGWWCDDRQLAIGTRYGFRLDGDAEVLYDPRGRALPDGVHGLSQVVDAARADTSRWAGRAWDGGVIYELHLGTFTPLGTLDAAIERLDHLVDLGIAFVELLPVNAFNGTHNWGYDGVAWFAVHQGYGGPAAYRRFVAACHQRGLGVIQDVVYNHLGPSGNVLPQFGQYLRADASGPWGDALDLTEPEVRRFILDNARMWFEEYAVDGLRLDAVHALIDPTPVHLLAELAEQTDELSRRFRRPLTLIAESDLNDPVMILPRPAGGYGLTAQWSDDYHHAVHAALTGEGDGYYADFTSLDALAKAATSGFFHDGTYSSFRGRDHGAPIPLEVATTSLVTFAQDHDQIGNRATGDRLSATLSPARLRIAAFLSMASPFTPMLFMGEEWGASTPWQFFTSHPEPELGEAVARGRIEEFSRMGWEPDEVPDPQDPATFARSHLDWDEVTRSPHRELHDLTRELIALRSREPEFTEPDFRMLSAAASDATGRFVLRHGALELMVNLGGSGWESTRSAVLLLATDPGVRADASGVILPADTAAIVRRDVQGLID